MAYKFNPFTGTFDDAGSGSNGTLLYRLNSDLAGASSSSAQATYGVGVSLSASTVYAFESYYVLQKTTGTTSHTIGTAFAGTATLNNLNYGAIWTREASVSTSSSMSGISAYHAFSTTTANLVLTTAITTSGNTFVASLSGTVSVNAAGTFIPQYKLSAAPGGAYSTLAGSYFRIWPIGVSGSNSSVGTWA